MNRALMPYIGELHLVNLVHILGFSTRMLELVETQIDDDISTSMDRHLRLTHWLYQLFRGH